MKENPAFIHGSSRRGQQTREYVAWVNMRQRCNNSRKKEYKNYGGRGISYIKEWDSFAAFLSDMGHCPPGLTLERINVNRGYSKDNCKWASRAEQNTNRQRHRVITWMGTTAIASEWARKIGISATTLHMRLKYWGVVAKTFSSRKFR